MTSINIPPGQVQVISPSTVEAMICGVKYVTRSRNDIVFLHYENGEKESAIMTRQEWENSPTIFSLVSFVQSKRTK